MPNRLPSLRLSGKGGTLVVDGEAGTFDEHSQRLTKSSLNDILQGDTGLGKVTRLDALKYAQQRILGTEGQTRLAIRNVLAGATVKPEFAALGSDGKPLVGVELHEFRNGAVTLIGLLNNPRMQIDDLGQPDPADSLKSRQRFEKLKISGCSLHAECMRMTFGAPRRSAR